MCFNVFIICNHEKGTSIEIGSSRGGGEGKGREGPWNGDGGEKRWREKKKSVCVCFSISLLTVFL